jgi:vesicle coat complex subunit
MKLRSDLPIKYYLNVHNEEDLRDDLAVLFDIIQYLIKVIQVKQKELELKNLKFTSKSLKYIFGDNIKNETFKSDLVKRLKNLIESGNLQVDGETIYITEKGLTNFYII